MINNQQNNKLNDRKRKNILNPTKTTTISKK